MINAFVGFLFILKMRGPKCRTVANEVIFKLLGGDVVCILNGLELK
jgi:hypothetical protein